MGLPLVPTKGTVAQEARREEEASMTHHGAAACATQPTAQALGPLPLGAPLNRLQHRQFLTRIVVGRGAVCTDSPRGWQEALQLCPRRAAASPFASWPSHVVGGWCAAGAWPWLRCQPGLPTPAWHELESGDREGRGALTALALASGPSRTGLGRRASQAVSAAHKGCRGARLEPPGQRVSRGPHWGSPRQSRATSGGRDAVWGL